MPRTDVDVLAHDFSTATKAAAFKPLFAAVGPDRCVPTGCTILNLVLSGRVDGGWLRGRIARVIGDSDTGKTMLCLTTLAEMSSRKEFENWRKIFDDAEVSNEFDLSQWGKLQDEIEAPGEDPSYYIEEFYGRVFTLLQESKHPFVYVLDSADALESKASVALFHTHLKELSEGKELSGSYGDGKAKVHSQNLRKLKADLKKTESVLLIISQTRDVINPVSFATKTTAGGRALMFYACYQLWLAKQQNLTRQINGRNQTVGTLVRVKVDKNHATGKHLEFSMPVYYGWGIDDERCSILWLISQNVWKKSGRSVDTKGFLKEKVQEKKLAQLLRSDDSIRTRFNTYLQEKWDEIESRIRKPGRYSGGDESDNDSD